MSEQTEIKPGTLVVCSYREMYVGIIEEIGDDPARWNRTNSERQYCEICNATRVRYHFGVQHDYTKDIKPVSEEQKKLPAFQEKIKRLEEALQKRQMILSILAPAVEATIALKEGTRIGIIGSRSFAKMELVTEFVAALPLHLIIVSGKAIGVDQHAAACARDRTLIVDEMPFDSSKGRSGGIARNIKLVQSVKCIVAFWDGSSPGTEHAIKFARSINIPVYVVLATKPNAPAVQTQLF